MRQTISKTLAVLAPCAAILAASAPASAGTTCQNLWCQSSEGFSDGGFGSSYSLWAGTETKKDHASDPSYDSAYLKVGGDLSVTAKAFGSSKTIAEAYAIGSYNQGVGSAGFELAAVGTVLYSGSLTNTVTFGISRNFFNVDDSINLLGVKINLKAKVTGELGIDATPAFGDGKGISVTTTPFARGYTEVDASVGASCASVGVSGSLTAIDFSAPIVAGGWVFTNPSTSTTFLWLFAQGDYALHSLDGKLKVNLKYCLDSDSKTLVNFGGFSTSGTLIDTMASLPL